MKHNKFANKNGNVKFLKKSVYAGLQYVLVLLDRSWQVRTCPISDFWSNFVCFGFKIKFLKKILYDSALFCVEKLKKHILNPKHAKLDQKSEIGHVRAVGGGRPGGRRRSAPVAAGRRRSPAVGAGGRRLPQVTV